MTARMKGTTARKMIKALKRLGFVVVKIRGSHVILRKGIKETCVPYHGHEMSRRLQMDIIKQAGLTIEEIEPYL
jgi:predicted RNA binding protein YcfA (HicA-like mRNA interferase family)